MKNKSNTSFNCNFNFNSKFFTEQKNYFRIWRGEMNPLKGHENTKNPRSMRMKEGIL